MRLLRLITLFLIIYFILAIISPIKAMHIYSILDSYLYIGFTKVLMYIIEISLVVRGVF